MFNFATILESSAQDHPKHTAIIAGERRLTYQELNQAANRVANGLVAQGVQPGDRVMMCCPNLAQFPIIYYGILKMGGVVVPVNTLFKRRELGALLRESGARAFFCFEGTAELPTAQEGFAAYEVADDCEHFYIVTAKEGAPSAINGIVTLDQFMENQSDRFDLVQRSPEDTATILFTSGTTGNSKGAELTHHNNISCAMIFRDLERATTGDVYLITLPMFHTFGQSTQLNAGILCGATLVLIPRFHPDDVLEAMETHSVTIFCGVPTMYWTLLHHPRADQYDLEKISANLRIGISGGAAMPVELLQVFERKFNIHILEGYGLSETGSAGTFNRLDKPRKVGSIGLPVWSGRIRIVDEEGNDRPIGEPGELILRNAGVMKGYLNNPEATRHAFRGDWFHTGDVARVDEDGYYYIVDRVKDIIIRGGYNVYPREVEEVLMSHPQVKLAAVIGVEHEVYGEEVKAYVIPSEDAGITEKELVAWSKDQMAAYKYPREIEFVESLPMSATGKILKTELRKVDKAERERGRDI